MTSTRRMVLLTIAVGLMVVGSASMALAQYPPGQDLSVTVFPEDPEAGDTVTATVLGAEPGETLDWEASWNPVFATGSTVADADGNAVFTFEVPDDVPAGSTITVSVTGSVSGDADAEVVTVAEVDDTDDPAADDTATDADAALSRTGLETATYLLAAVMLIGLGGVAIVGARRRERSRIDA